MLKELDRLERDDVRRKHGRFFTTVNVADDKIDSLMLDVCREFSPDIVIEPYIGAGTLVSSIIKENYSGIGNDIAAHHVDPLKTQFEGYDWNFTKLDLPDQTPKILLEVNCD